MNPLQEPLTSPRNAGRPPDEIDGLLRAFFGAELPAPWPVLKAPPAEETPASVRRPQTWAMMPSRLALAASIGLLLIGCWFLSETGSDRPVAEPGVLPEATAERGKGGRADVPRDPLRPGVPVRNRLSELQKK